MLSEALKERLSSLRRGQTQPSRARWARPALTTQLADCFPEGAVRSTRYGEVFVCEPALREAYSDAARLTAAYLAAFEEGHRRPDKSGAGSYLELLRAASPAGTVLIDTETAGLHGRPLFLIGLVRWQGEELVLTQYFAQDYSREPAVLGQLAELLPGIELLVSFNGKAFDWPLVRDRMTYHRLRCRPAFAHLDLLHPSRRRWRAQLPNCKLRTLEQYLCGRWRSGDIPSHEIPQRYHDFVREQDARLIAPVFHHNRLDLITMVELLVALSEGKQPTHNPALTGWR